MLLDESRLPANAAISFHYEPVLRVGGDWFSVIESRDGNSLYMLLGDVTGHGLAQGLVTTAMAGALSVVEATIREGEGGTLTRPSQIVTQLGNVVRKLAGKSNLRMTCVAAKLDFRTMQLLVCNAGHTFPLRLHQRPGEKIKVESLAKNQQYMLGDDSPEIEAHEYTDAVYEFHKDDLLLFYTDGLTEAVDKEGRAFNRKFHRHFGRMEEARSVQQLRDDLLKLFKSHVADVPVKDDICLLIVGQKSDKQVQAA
jgi:serine phosphatase RsbU (regulator of sigma subunit)